MKSALLALLLGGGLSAAASADLLVLPDEGFARDRPATIRYRLSEAATGTGIIAIEWTDAANRLIERRDMPVSLAHASEVAIALDLRRAVVARNVLRAHLSLDAVDRGGVARYREGSAAIAFSLPPPRRPWSDYQIIMWQPHPAAQYVGLKALGVTAAMVPANRIDPGDPPPETLIAPLLRNDLPWYVENIATDFYAPYHRWTPGKPVNALFLEAQQRYAQNPLDPAAFLRTPSLSDPQWLARIGDRLAMTVRAHAPYRPLYYNLGDETGIADLAAFWDFDLSEDSLREMRRWLEEQYGSLAALNQQWGSGFAGWDQVVPMLTREAITRSDGNYSAWADFKEWMDVAFARALKSGSAAVHAADPEALAAIEGGQVPGWGGYDYSRLADAVDLMELYDSGRNFDIVRSLNSAAILLTTAFETGPREAHRVWRALLHGSRGLILWDEADDFVQADGAAGPRGRDAAAYFGAIRGGLGALLINSRPADAEAAILYSPASLRIRWLLDRAPEGEAWSRRGASSDYEGPNAIRQAADRYASALEHLGMPPRFIASDRLARGDLRRAGYKVLILPHAIALAPAEAAEIRAFVARGGTLVVEGEAGSFDHHGRRLASALLADLFAGMPNAGTGTASFGAGKTIRHAAAAAEPAPPGAFQQSLAAALANAGVGNAVAVTGPDGAGDVAIHRFGNGDVSIIAVQRDLPSDPAMPDGGGTARAERFAVRLPEPLHVTDLRSGKALGQGDRFELALDPVTPTFLALSRAALPPPVLSAPATGRLGETVVLHIHGAGAALDVIHLEVVDPTGAVSAPYSGNHLAPRGDAAIVIPLALNDPAGTWTLRVSDVLSGQSTRATLEVSPP